MSSWPRGDPDVVARAVLAGAAYRSAPHESAHPPAPSFWQTVWGWFVEHVVTPLFAPLLHALAGAAGSGLGSAFAIVLVVFALGLLALVAFRLARAFAREAADGVRPSGGARSLLVTHDAAAWRALAREAASRGEFARAIGCVFAAALAVLDERAIVARDDARTPGEYRRIVRRERAPAAAAFDELATGFVRASYAPERPDAADYARVAAAYERFEPATRA